MLIDGPTSFDGTQSGIRPERVCVIITGKTYWEDCWRDCGTSSVIRNPRYFGAHLWGQYIGSLHSSTKSKKPNCFGSGRNRGWPGFGFISESDIVARYSSSGAFFCGLRLPARSTQVRPIPAILQAWFWVRNSSRGHPFSCPELERTGQFRSRANLAGSFTSSASIKATIGQLSMGIFSLFCQFLLVLFASYDISNSTASPPTSKLKKWWCLGSQSELFKIFARFLLFWRNYEDGGCCLVPVEPVLAACYWHCGLLFEKCRQVP